MFNHIQGLVLDGKVDFAAIGFGITRERMNELDFLITAQGAMGRIYIRNPKDVVDWNVYINPLKTGAWIGIVLFFVIVLVPMMVVNGGKCYYSLAAAQDYYCTKSRNLMTTRICLVFHYLIHHNIVVSIPIAYCIARIKKRRHFP